MFYSHRLSPPENSCGKGKSLKKGPSLSRLRQYFFINFKKAVEAGDVLYASSTSCLILLPEY
jgi:hypothetical protein